MDKKISYGIPFNPEEFDARNLDIEDGMVHFLGLNYQPRPWPKLYLHGKISLPEHLAGVVVVKSYNFPKGMKYFKSTGQYVQDWRVAHHYFDHHIPEDKPTPYDPMGEVFLRAPIPVSFRLTGKNRNGQKIPEAVRYTVVDRIIGWG